MEILITIDDPVATKIPEYGLGIISHKAALCHTVEVTERSINKQEVYILGVTTRNMRSHSASKGTSKTADLSLEAQGFDQKLEHAFTIMVGRVGIGYSFRPTITSVIPCQNINII